MKLYFRSNMRWKFFLSLIGFKLSNDSLYSRKVTDYIQTPAFKEIANTIIPILGDIENQGRAFVAESVTSKENFNFKNINKFIVSCNYSILLSKTYAWSNANI